MLIGGPRDNGTDTFRFAFGAGQGVDTIQDFETTERIELRGVTQAQLDTNNNGVIDNADDGVTAGFGPLEIFGLFPLVGTLRVFGSNGTTVTSLVIGDDVFFVA